MMYRPRPRLVHVIGLLTAGVLLVGCSESGVTVESVDPARSAESSSAVAPTSTQESSTAIAPSSPDPSATEAADRAAAEGQWIQSWNVYLEIARTPVAERDALAATVTVDAAKARMLTDAGEFDRQGLQTYGQLGHRISWPQPINGSNSVLIDDCQDASQTGSMEAATGNKVTAGVSRDHYQGRMTRGEDGIWRVAEVFYLQDEPC